MAAVKYCRILTLRNRPLRFMPPNPGLTRASRSDEQSFSRWAAGLLARQAELARSPPVGPREHSDSERPAPSRGPKRRRGVPDLPSLAPETAAGASARALRAIG